MLYTPIYIFKLNFALRGALTNRPAAFRSRPWELRSVRSFDLLDSLNSAIEFNIRGSDFIRVLPSISSLVVTGSEWISDRIRYSVDAFRLQRIDTPFIRLHKKGFVASSWKTTFTAFMEFSRTNPLNVFQSSQVVPFKPFSGTYLNLFDNSGVPFGLSAYFWADRLFDLFSRNRFLDTSNFAASEINPQLQFSARRLLIENNKLTLQFSLQNYSSLYIVGSEIAVSQPVLWSAINQAISQASLKVYSFSDAQPTKFSHLIKRFKHLGSVSSFKRFIDGRHWQNLASLNKGDKALVLVVINSSNDFPLFTYVESRLKKESGCVSLSPLFNTNNPLHNSLSGLSSSAPAALSLRKSSTNSLFLANSLSIAKGAGYSRSTTAKLRLFAAAPTINCASHANLFANSAKFLTPISTFFETSETVQNLIGERRSTTPAINSPGLSVAPSRFFLLLYTLFIKGLSPLIRNQFQKYLFDSVTKGFLKISSLNTQFMLLKEIVAAGLAGDLSLSFFLYSIESKTAKFVVPKVLFGLLASPLATRQSIQLHQGTISELISNGYLGFNDELTSHSVALTEARLLLSKHLYLENNFKN